MLRPGGFPEYLPGEQLIFEKIKDIISKNYQKFGYTPIMTPAVENNNILLKGGEESSKQIFGLYGLVQGPKDAKKYSLHFDLTVPFARYVLDNQGELTFPFKRSQIQPVRRGERQQKGRFREFRQADIDVIWENDTNLLYDAEVIYTAMNTIQQIFDESTFDLPIGKNKNNVVMKISNRKIMQGLVNELLDQDLHSNIFKLFDDYYKLGQTKFEKELNNICSKNTKKRLFSDKIVNFILKFTTTKLESLDKLGIQNKLFQQGITELKSVFSFLKQLNIFTNYKFEFDPFIMRGLDYYTGTVVETFLSDDIHIGSICSGGRYENLTQLIDPKSKNYQGVGISIGLSRLVTILLEKIEKTSKKDFSGLEKKTKQTCTQYLFINFEKTIGNILKLSTRFAKQGKNIEIYPTEKKLGKQFKYAEKKGIPFVIVLGEDELQKGIYKIKNMKTGEEVEEKL